MNQNRSHQVRLGQFVLSALVTLSLVACGGGGGSTKPDASSVTDAPASNSPAAAPPSAQTPDVDVANNSPHIDGDLILTATAGASYSFTPDFGDVDKDDLLTLSVDGNPAWLSFDRNTGTLSGTPLEGNVGQTSDIVITVTDGKATQSLGPFSITVVSANAPPRPTNQPPVITGSPSTVTVALQPYIFIPKATDAENDKITWAVSNLPPWASFSTATGQISGTPPRAAAKTKTFSNIRIVASDGTLKSELAFDLVVQPAPLVITNQPATSITAGTTYSYTPVIDKIDGVKLTWSIANKPSWATFNTSTGVLSGAPAAGNIGTTLGIRILATDGLVTGETSAFNIAVVAAPNTAPTITGTPPTTVQAGQTYSFKPTGKDKDTGDTLAYSIANKPDWATFSIATGELSGSPSAGDARTYSGIVITVKDGKSSASLASFSITVTAPPAQTGSAKLSWQPPETNTDGTELTTLAGFKIYYGTSASNLDQVIDVGSPDATSYTVNGLTRATWYFSVRSYSSTGLESGNSNLASKAIN